MSWEDWKTVIFLALSGALMAIFLALVSTS
jgi:hypothetical protein